MRTRRLGVFLGLALTLGALAGVPMNTATAAPGCLSEPPPGLLQPGCDDEVPPETALTGVSTQPNAAGWVPTSTMSFAFTGAHTDADPGAARPRVQARRPGAGPRLDGLHLAAHLRGPDRLGCAVHVLRAGRRHRRPGLRLDTFGDTELVEDFDASPATLTWGQDSVAPVGFVNPDTYDDETPQQPVVVGRSVPIRLNSNESGAGFECEVDGASTPCTPGAWRYTDATSGRHFFRARAVDKAGTPSAWSPTTEFFIPSDLRARRGWKKVKKSGAFDGTLVKSKTKGARLVLPVQRVGELRLYAPTAPSYGKVRVKIGATNWRVVDLSGPRSAQKEFVVIDRYKGARTGKVLIEVLTRNKPVLLDAIVARSNVFQG